MKHPRFTAWLCSAAALVLLAVPAFAQQPDALPPEQTAPAAQEQPAEAAALDAEAPTEEAPAADPQRTYVALGDSIVSGVGLPDFKYTEAAIGIDAAPNFEGYPEQCYVSLVGKGLGLDRQHAINLGLPGLTTGDLADMLHTGAMPQMNQQAGTYYVYPQMLDYLKRADVISVQIGSNDALVPALVALGNATNWKSEQLVATMVSGVLREPSFENLQRLNSDLSRLRLTKEEKQATTQLLLGGGTDAICEQAYQEAAVHMPQVVAELRALNPHAQNILLGYTNPVPLLPEWTQLFRRLNALSKNLAAQNENVTYVPIPFAMTATDAHPTVSGHKYIANRILTVSLLAWFVAQVLKTLINFILLGKFQLERMWGDGGMPSAHSATVCAMVIATARCEGIDSAIFAVACVVAIITMHDAMGVRHETGEQAKVLNQMIDQWIEVSEKNAPFLQNMHLKEMVGHTPLQVVAGFLVGLVVGLLYPLGL